MKLKSKSLPLMGLTFFSLPCISPLVSAMEQIDTSEYSDTEIQISPPIKEAIKEGLIIKFNNPYDRNRQQLLRQTLTSKPIRTGLLCLSAINELVTSSDRRALDFLSENTKGFLPKTVELGLILYFEESQLLEIIESTVSQILDPTIQEAVNLLIFKNRNNGLDKGELKIKYFKTFFQEKLPEVAHEAIILEGINQHKINKIARPALKRQTTFSDKIKHLVIHDLIEYNWLINESKNYLADMFLGTIDINQHGINEMERRKSETELGETLAHQN